MGNNVRYYFALVAVLLFWGGAFAQFQIPNKEFTETSIYDPYYTLYDYQRNQLEEKLINYADSTSTQIVVAIVPELNGSKAEYVAPEWAQAWGVGQKENDNGIFILVSIKEHDMYIATGFGVQDRLPAARVSEIIEQFITPEFKDEDYFEGLDAGTDAIIASLSGKFKAKEEGSVFDLLLGIAILLVILFLIGKAVMEQIKREGKGTGVTRFSRSSYGYSSRSRSGGSRSGGGTFGGFGGGFGGGSFSGGGAGGSW